MYTYPFVNGAGQDIDSDAVHYFLKSPRLVAKRIGKLINQRFIADWLLQGRYNADGGAISWLVDDGLYTDDDLRTITPGGDYPLTTASEGSPEQARVEKEGQDSEITDEAIKALLMDPVNRVMQKHIAQTVRRVDSKALAVVTSEVTATHAGAAWTTLEALLLDVGTADAKLDDLDLGLNADAIVMKPLQYAKVVALLAKADILAKGLAAEYMKSGVMTDVLGLSWARSKHVPFTDPLLIDRSQLGGIAAQDLGSPGYVKVNPQLGIDTKVWRPTDTDKDLYRLRVRRVGTAVVVEPRAGIRITGTGL